MIFIKNFNCLLIDFMGDMQDTVRVNNKTKQRHKIMNPVVIIIAKKTALLTKKLSALKARSNKVKTVLEILRLESLVPSLTEISPIERVKIHAEMFKALSLGQKNLIYGKKLKWISYRDPNLVLDAEKFSQGDQKICEYFYSQFLIYSSL